MTSVAYLPANAPSPSRRTNRHFVLPPNLPPRGLSREEAAGYIGISATKFDELVADGRMPEPKRIDSRKIWDREALDRAFEALPGQHDDENPWDKLV